MELYFKQNLCPCHLDAFILYPTDSNPVHPVFQGGSTPVANSCPFGIYGKQYRGILVLGSASVPEDTDDDAAYPGRLYFAGPPPF